jgi:hypothetical protein
MKNAMIAVVRTLAVILHRMWIEGTEFIFAKGAAVIEKRVLICTNRRMNLATTHT